MSMTRPKSKALHTTLNEETRTPATGVRRARERLGSVVTKKVVVVVVFACQLHVTGLAGGIVLLMCQRTRQPGTSRCSSVVLACV